MARLWVAVKDSGALQVEVEVMQVRSIHSSIEVEDAERSKKED